MRQTIAVLCTVLLACNLVRADRSLYATSSVLSKGRWVKIRVSDDGIYKLTHSDLKAMGFSDPSKVSIHGYGGWILDEDFSKPYIDDVPATAIYRGTDYILFYGRGPVKWSYDSHKSLFVHENNPYAMHGYYFVTDATETHDMSTTPSQGNPLRKVTTFDEHLLHEIDREFLQKEGQTGSGRELFGESFTSVLSQNFPFSMPGITSDDGKITLRFVANTGVTGDGTVTLSIDGQQLLHGVIPQSDCIYIYTKACEFVGTAVWKGQKSENPKVTVSYNRPSSPSFLDYIRLQARRILKPYGAYTFFRDVQSRQEASQFVIRNATSDMVVFDVTDGVKVTRMEASLNGSELSFSIPASHTVVREFVLVDLSKSFPQPEMVGEVTAQDLHALPQTDMVILSPPAFVPEAERLAAAHRRKRDSIHVTVVTPEQVYNEFSSGTPDATAIRRFMKMFYDRRTSEADAPKYLLLFGDGAHDNRQLSTAWKSIDMTNFLLTFQTQQSIMGGNYNQPDKETYVTDDYFGFLRDGSGSDIGRSYVDLGIGRFPVRTVNQAKAIVDKVVRYIETPAYGSWKNQLCFIADDGSSSEHEPYAKDHMEQSYQLTQIIEDNHPEYITNKLFFDAFKKSSKGSSGSYPDVERNIQKLQRQGVMLINYTGHGNAASLSDEHVITQSMIRQYTYPHLPLWITASCDFTPFDHTTTSAGEDVFLTEKSGGIALITTSRVAFGPPNFAINRLLVANIFKKNKGKRMTLGDVLKETKNGYRHYFNRCFVLIGDPALSLAYPEYEMNVKEINGNPVSETSVNFKALDRVTVTGEVTGADGAILTNFNGQMTAVVLDSQQEITTLDNNRKGEKFSYKDYPNTIYKGNAIVENGKFTFSFIVPADISYANGPGKMSLYAFDETNALEANGSFLKYTVGGTANPTERDTVKPEIRMLYLNDSTWTDGHDTNETPLFVAKVWDKSGINITGSSIGHDVMLTIDNNPSLSYTLNAYYTNIAGSEGEGIVKFPIPALPEGKHTAEFKIWDIFNNSTTKTFTFNVVKGLKPFLSGLTAGPVPAREKVTFYLYHNRPESKIDATIYVYDLSGRLYWKHQEIGSSDLFKAYTVTWDLTSSDGTRLRPGIYLYRAVIRSGSSAEATLAKKMIILAK